MTKVDRYSKEYGIIFTLGMVVLMITATTASGVFTSFPKVMAQTTEKFNATLSGDSEVPPVNTKALGNANFELNQDGHNMSYTINVKDMDVVTQAHIHKGKVGKNGPVVVTLYSTENKTSQGGNLLIADSFTSAKFEGPLKGKSMNDLLDIIKNKDAYVNVHSEKHPKGEIRGTIETG